MDPVHTLILNYYIILYKIKAKGDHTHSYDYFHILWVIAMMISYEY